MVSDFSSKLINNFSRLWQNPPCADVAFHIVFHVGETVDDHTPVAGMDKSERFAVLRHVDHDSHMAYGVDGLAAAEEYKVAGTKLVFLYGPSLCELNL